MPDQPLACDLLVHSATQLLTLAGGPQRGARLGALGIIEDGAVAIRDGRVLMTGPTAELRLGRRPEALKPFLDEGIECGKHYFQFAIWETRSPGLGVRPSLPGTPAPMADVGMLAGDGSG